MLPPAGDRPGRALHVSPDFDYTKPEPNTDLEFVHRALPGVDLYFVDNRGNRAETVDATFRIAGRAPELWSAETGATAPASYTITDGRTTVPLHLGPWGTTFVVFRQPTTATSRREPTPVETTLASVDGPWNVAFQPGRGAPASITLAALSPWNENADPGVKYFSGVGTYTRTIEAAPEWFTAGDHVWLDLGDVKNLADVTVNGKDLGVVWHPPYRVDVTGALHPGANELSIKVVNAWVNRLIGDQQPGATPVAWADVTPYHADSPLLPSGLLGPVQVIRQSTR